MDDMTQAWWILGSVPVVMMVAWAILYVIGSRFTNRWRM